MLELSSHVANLQRQLRPGDIVVAVTALAPNIVLSTLSDLRAVCSRVAIL